MLDADKYAGELLENPEVCKEIRQVFGSEVFAARHVPGKGSAAEDVSAEDISGKNVLGQNSGEKAEGEDTGEAIDRAALASRVFACEENRKKINAIIHPRVRARIREEVTSIRKSAPDKIIVLDIPLLVGSELRSLCDLLVMVETSLENRLRRVADGRGWKPEELQRREKYQPSVEDKRKEASAVIRNDGTLEDLEDEIDSFMQYIQEMDEN